MIKVKTIDARTVEQSLVLVHGLCCAASDFQWHINAFVQTYRVLAPTLRGHASGSFLASELTIELMASDIARTQPDHLGRQASGTTGTSPIVC